MKLDEIARLAGVSRTTASYVINGKAKQRRVSEATVAKVMAVVRQYNYHPNAVAAGLRGGRSRSIGLVLPDLENQSYTRIANLLERQARRHGYQLLIACSDDQPADEMHCVEHLLQRQVDALIVSSALPAQHPFYQQHALGKVPIIALDRALDAKRVISVVGDDQQDARLLAQALAQQAFSSLLFFGAQPELSVSHWREQGFRQAFQGDSRPLTYLYSEGYQRQQGYQAFQRFLSHNPLPQALFVTSFGLLQGVIDAGLARLGALPEHLIIATFGDHELLDFLPCPVLSVGQRHQEIAERLMSLVIERLDGVSQEIDCFRVPRRLYWHGKSSSGAPLMG